MKAFKLRAFSFFALVCLAIPFSAARAADTNPPPRLTVELRDGSRVVGTSAEKFFKFHSALLGDFKLAVKDIRTVECVAINSAKLTTTRGDILTVWFADSQIRVETSFGKVSLDAVAVRRCTVATTANSSSAAAGLIALWSGEGNGRDSVGNNDAQLTDIDFATGKCGQAFALNGFNSYLQVASNLSSLLAQGDGLTLSVWIKPSDISGLHPIIQWINYGSPTPYGVSLRIGHQPDDQGVIYGNLFDAGNHLHELISPPGVLASGTFQRVALTYDKASGQAFLYLNGAVVAQDQLQNPVPFDSVIGDFWIGRFFGDQPGSWSYHRFYAGFLDEIAVYNRALSGAEIREDYKAGKPD